MGTLREDYTLVLDAGTFGIICRKDYRKELDRIIFLARLFSERGLHPGDRIYLLRSQKLKKLQGTDPVLEHTELKKLKRKEEQKNVAQLMKILFTDRAFLGIIISALFLLLAQLTLSNMMNYVFPNYFQNAKFLSVSGLVGCGIVLVLAMFSTKLAGRFGKKELAAGGAVVAAVSQFVVFVIHTHNIGLYIVIYCITYAGMAFFNLLCWAMIIDVIDEIEVKNNVRSDGTVYSVYSFARKLGQAGSTGISGVMLGIAGYSAKTQFDTDVVNSIYNLATLVPAILFALMAASLLFIYPLTKKKVDDNVETLRAKREGK